MSSRPTWPKVWTLSQSRRTATTPPPKKSESCASLGTTEAAICSRIQCHPFMGVGDCQQPPKAPSSKEVLTSSLVLSHVAFPVPRSCLALLSKSSPMLAF